MREPWFPPEDLALIRRRRRPANRLGFAVQLAYLRHPGRAIEAGEAPPGEMLAFIAQQLGLAPAALPDYARRDTTRREHLLGHRQVDAGEDKEAPSLIGATASCGSLDARDLSPDRR